MCAGQSEPAWPGGPPVRAPPIAATLRARWSAPLRSRTLTLLLIALVVVALVVIALVVVALVVVAFVGLAIHSDDRAVDDDGRGALRHLAGLFQLVELVRRSDHRIL